MKSERKLIDSISIDAIRLQVIQRLLVGEVVTVHELTDFHGNAKLFGKLTPQCFLFGLPVAVLPSGKLPKSADGPFILAWL